jgi:hypothetical protein
MRKQLGLYPRDYPRVEKAVLGVKHRVPGIPGEREKLNQSDQDKKNDDPKRVFMCLFQPKTQDASQGHQRPLKKPYNGLPYG